MNIKEVLQQRTLADSADEVMIALAPDRRRGVKIVRHPYETCAQFIITALQERFEIELKDLIDRAHQTLTHQFTGNISYVLLVVKSDLEERKIIQVKRNTSTRIQIVRLRKKIT